MRPTSEDHDAKAERRLRDSGALREFVHNVPGAIYVMTDAGRVLDGNPAFLTVIGADSLQQAQNLDGHELWVDRARRAEALVELGRTGKLRDFECDLRRLDGTVRTVLDTCVATRDGTTGDMVLSGFLVDVTERKQAEDELRSVAVRDALTGCYNRWYLEELSGALENDAVWGAIVVDIDRFKEYNDQFGHKKGDEVLVRLAAFLTRLVRPDDAVIRLGGDEFLILLFGDDVNFISEIAHRFTETAPKKAPVPFSLGWAVRDKSELLEATIARADQELIHVRVQERRYSQIRRSGGFGSSPKK